MRTASESKELEAFAKEFGDEFFALYGSQEAVEQRLLYGQNVFRVFDGGRLHVVPYAEWPKGKPVAMRGVRWWMR